MRSGRPRQYTDEQALAMLRAETKRRGHLPTTREMKAPDSVSLTEGFYKRRFGSMRRAVELAGLTPRRPGGMVRHGLRVGKQTLIASLRPIDPARAAEITARKMAYWGIRPAGTPKREQAA